MSPEELTPQQLVWRRGQVSLLARDLFIHREVDIRTAFMWAEDFVEKDLASLSESHGVPFTESPWILARYGK